MTVLLVRTPGSRTASGHDVGGSGYNVRAPILNITALLFGNWPFWLLLDFCYLAFVGLLAFISLYGMFGLTTVVDKVKLISNLTKQSKAVFTGF